MCKEFGDINWPLSEILIIKDSCNLTAQDNFDDKSCRCLSVKQMTFLFCKLSLISLSLSDNQKREVSLNLGVAGQGWPAWLKVFICLWFIILWWLFLCKKQIDQFLLEVLMINETCNPVGRGHFDIQLQFLCNELKN